MDYYPRGTLKNALGQLGWSTCKSYLLSVLDGLAQLMHMAWFIETSSRRIFCWRSRPVISDFGIAIGSMRKRGSSRNLLSERPYTAPEHRRQDAALGPWTDFYALGCMCYWLCTGVAPCWSEHGGISGSALKARPASPDAQFSVPSEFKEWVANCLAKPTSERPQLAPTPPMN